MFAQNAISLLDETPMKDRVISRGYHWQYGWLRRPELDDENGYCYEEPDGDQVFSLQPHHVKNMHLTCYEDRKTKERYTALSKMVGPIEMMEYLKRRK